MNKIFHHINSLIETDCIIIFGLSILVISFVITYRMIPVIIATSKYKGLMIQPNHRSSHVNHTPSLGGVAFFGSFLISLFFMQFYDKSGVGYHLIASTCILFYLGLKDDLMVLSAKTKVILQSVAVFFIILESELLITDFHGFLWIHEIPLWLSASFGYLVIIYIINAYNLIDGIDGLAGMLGIVISFTFAVLFYFSGIYYYFFLALVIIGYLFAFLRFNLSNHRRIFMGDTGSMITGVLIAVMALRLMSLKAELLNSIFISPRNVFIVTIAILFFPAIDVLRVIVVRLLNKRRPFSPDRAHLHHVFIDKGLKHISASKTIAVSNVLVLTIVYSINRYFSFGGLLFVFGLISFFTFYVLLLLDKDPKVRQSRKKIVGYFPKWVYHLEFRIRKGIIVFLKKVFYKNLL